MSDQELEARIAAIEYIVENKLYSEEMKKEIFEELDMLTKELLNENEVVSADTAVEPNHYTKMAIPPNEYITANKLGWYEANIVKYVSRYKLKNCREDLLKARKYLDMLIESDLEC